MAEIYDKYKNAVYRTAFTMCKNASDAEDITQEVFLKRFTCNTSFESDEHEKAWLLRVTANKCKDLFRLMFRKHVSLEDADITYETPEESMVYHAVMELPAGYRIVIHLYYYEGYSVKEIGQITEQSETTVQTKLYRARQKLKKKLGEELQL